MEEVLYMERIAIEQLKQWKNSAFRKPLLVEGARQVGKTWLLKHFGEKCYRNTAYFRFDSDELAQRIFEKDLRVDRLLDELGLASGMNLRAPDTLIIFDEIQECPRALTSLKYFCEEKPDVHIVAAGSLLGVSLAAGVKSGTTGGTGFPVGKVDHLSLYPLTFAEFMRAVSQDGLQDAVDNRKFDTIKVFSSEYARLLKTYFVIGGMPEVVEHFRQNRDFAAARRIQQRILRDYDLDFAKHAPREIVPKMRMIWNSLPAQLAKENKKFVYTDVKSGAKSRDFESSLEWLVDAGLVQRVNRVTTPSKPLCGYRDGAFKLFFLDTGMLAAMSGLAPNVILDGNRVFTEFKGALTEQFVQQELRALFGYDTAYYSNGRTEIDFLIDTPEAVLPIEVKSETNRQAKSLRAFCEKFAPKSAIRFSMGDYSEGAYPFGTSLIDYPLYAVSALDMTSAVINQRCQV